MPQLTKWETITFEGLYLSLSCIWLTHCGLVMPYSILRSSSTLVQVMTCCLTAPNHYLNQYWLITWQPFFQKMLNTSVDKKKMNDIFQLMATSPRVQWVKYCLYIQWCYSSIYVIFDNIISSVAFHNQSISYTDICVPHLIFLVAYFVLWYLELWLILTVRSSNILWWVLSHIYIRSTYCWSSCQTMQTRKYC